LLLLLSAVPTAQQPSVFAAAPREVERLLQLLWMPVLSAKLVSMLAINARVPGSNPTIDGYFSTSLKALGKPLRLL